MKQWLMIFTAALAAGVVLLAAVIGVDRMVKSNDLKAAAERSAAARAKIIDDEIETAIAEAKRIANGNPANLVFSDRCQDITKLIESADFQLAMAPGPAARETLLNARHRAKAFLDDAGASH